MGSARVSSNLILVVYHILFLRKSFSLPSSSFGGSFSDGFLSAIASMFFFVDLQEVIHVYTLILFLIGRSFGISGFASCIASLFFGSHDLLVLFCILTSSFDFTSLGPIK